MNITIFDRILNVSHRDCKDLDVVMFILLLETKYYDNHSMHSDDGHSTNSVIFKDISTLLNKLNQHFDIFSGLMDVYPFKKYIRVRKGRIELSRDVLNFYAKHSSSPTQLNKHLYRLKSIEFIQFQIESFDKGFVILFKDKLKMFILSGLSFNRAYNNTLWNSFIKHVVPPLTLIIGFVTLWLKMHDK